MSRWFFVAVPLIVLTAAGVASADEKGRKDNNDQKYATGTITKVDAKNGEITVKFHDARGKEAEKTFHLSKEVRLLDETGRVAAVDVFESGSDVLVLEREGRLQELRRAPGAHGGRLSDALRTLIEMTDCEEGCVDEVQRMYDMLRKLDTAKNGKIDPNALKAERDHILAERVDHLMQRLDTNHDGKISKDEAKGLIKEHFDRIDANKDGVIDRDELLKAAKERRDAKTPAPEKK